MCPSRQKLLFHSLFTLWLCLPIPAVLPLLPVYETPSMHSVNINLPLFLVGCPILLDFDLLCPLHFLAKLKGWNDSEEGDRLRSEGPTDQERKGCLDNQVIKLGA